VIDVLRGEACSLEAISDRRYGKSRGIFDSVESLFFDSRYELAVAH
jgi:hypothetical protein